MESGLIIALMIMVVVLGIYLYATKDQLKICNLSRTTMLKELKEMRTETAELKEKSRTVVERMAETFKKTMTRLHDKCDKITEQHDEITALHGETLIKVDDLSAVHERVCTELKIAEDALNTSVGTSEKKKQEVEDLLSELRLCEMDKETAEKKIKVYCKEVGEISMAEDKLNIKIEELNVELNQLQENYKMMKEQSDGFEETFKDMVSKNTYDALGAEHETLQKVSTSLENSCKELADKLTDLESKNAELREVCVQKTETIDLLEVRISELQSESERLNNLIAELEKTKSELADTCTDLESKNAELLAENAELVNRIDHLKIENKNLDDTLQRGNS